MTVHVIETLESFGIDRSYQRDNLSGCAMDGQYIHLNFSGHLSNILLKEYHLTWDPAHRIELSINDSTSKPNERQTFVEVTCNTIESIMTQMSYGKPYRALLDDTPLIHHFLTPKIFKSMKFVGHCTAVLKSFTSNFKGIISALERMNTLETIALQQKILSLSFILDYLVMCDIMHHLTYCSKSVQRECTFPWMFIESIYSLLNTLTVVNDSLYLPNLLDGSLNKLLFPQFSECSTIIVNKEYKDGPLPDLPVSAACTRGTTAASPENSVEDFLVKKIVLYTKYINKLMKNIEDRFYSGSGTFEVCKNMGKLFNFNWLIYPRICEPNHQTNLTDLSFQKFSEILKVKGIKQLLFEYRELFKFVCSTADGCRDKNTACGFLSRLFKQFVHNYKGSCPLMFSMLSFIVSFPTSEAVVESWGSSIDHLNKTKPHTKEVLNVSDTGTIDKMVFIKLNGPPPGFRKNKRILKSALLLMFNGDSLHTSHILDRNLVRLLWL